MIIILVKMSQVNGSRLSEQSQGQGLNRPSNGKRFRVKQEGNKFKGSINVDPMFPILLHKVLSLSV
jgi:hypothetical protein